MCPQVLPSMLLVTEASLNRTYGYVQPSITPTSKQIHPAIRTCQLPAGHSTRSYALTKQAKRNPPGNSMLYAPGDSHMPASRRAHHSLLCPDEASQTQAPGHYYSLRTRRFAHASFPPGTPLTLMPWRSKLNAILRAILCSTHPAICTCQFPAGHTTRSCALAQQAKRNPPGNSMLYAPGDSHKPASRRALHSLLCPDEAS